MFLAIKTEDGAMKGKISFYCKSLGVTRQGFHNYLKYKDMPWKYQFLANVMLDICTEDECNDTHVVPLPLITLNVYTHSTYAKAEEAMAKIVKITPKAEPEKQRISV